MAGETVNESAVLSFKHQMEESAKKRNSNIVLALDPPMGPRQRLLRHSLKILEEVGPYICAVKLNRHLALPLGLFEDVRKLVNQAHEMGLPVIMDCKINDIGNTNQVIAKYYYEAGFDAVTANPFVGWEDGLQPVFEVARQMNRGVILLVYMSHRGAAEGYGQMVQDPRSGKALPQYVSFAEKALLWKADGVVVGATYPEKIREVYAVLKNRVPIYSPGIGFQGGRVESAIRAGARFLIVGRAIMLARKPAEAARCIRDAAQRFSDRSPTHT